MAEQKERPKPQGDPLSEEVEPNAAQRQSDAPSDATAGKDRLGTSDRADGRGSTANGVPQFDEDAGEERKKLYKDGAGLVSRID